ncbi:MAG: hypothetical protein M9933_03045 [Chitinophagaceae bacterium]|nr:hypothetical protein [Chitinophagaceae bacterium]
MEGWKCDPEDSGCENGSPDEDKGEASFFVAPVKTFYPGEAFNFQGDLFSPG